MKYIDPDGREAGIPSDIQRILDSREANNFGQLASATVSWRMQNTPWNTSYLGTSSDTVEKYGCKATAAAKMVSSMTGSNVTPDIMATYADSSGNLSQAAIAQAISDYSDKPVTTDYWQKQLNADRLSTIKRNTSGKTFVLARAIIGGGLGEHWVFLQDFSINPDGTINYSINGTSNNDYGTTDNGGVDRSFTSGSNDNSTRKATVDKIETYQQ